MIDWSIKIGDIVILVSLGGTSLLYAFRSGRFAESVKTIRKDLVEMKEMTKQMADVLIKVAVQDNRLNNSEERQNMTDRKLEDLRKGHGWVTGQKGIDREY